MRRADFPDHWRWISLARLIPGQLNDAEANSLFHLARSATPRNNPVILEVGFGQGRSSLLLAAALCGKFHPRLFRLAPPDRRAGDRGDPLAGTVAGRLEERLQRNLRRCGLAHIVRALEGTCSELVRTWTDPIDILLVHAGPDQESARNHCGLWSPFVKPGGLVALHGNGVEGLVLSQVLEEDLRPPRYGNRRQVDSLAWAMKHSSERVPEASATGGADLKDRPEIERLSAEVARLSKAVSWNQLVLAAAVQSAQRLNTEPDYLARELEPCAEIAVFPESDHEAAESVRCLRDCLRTAAYELAECRHATQALRSSWSWRLTAPLRALATVARACWLALRNAGIFRPRKILGFAQWLLFRNLVSASDLFDGGYYQSRNRDVVRLRMSPLLHFFVFGAAEERNPSALFDVGFYLRCNPDVARSAVNPLLHYLQWGAYEGRDPHPQFDSSFYLEQNPDVAHARLNPLAHYLAPGIAEGRDPSPWFDTSEYLARNPEVAVQGLNPLVHHLELHAETPHWRVASCHREE